MWKILRAEIIHNKTFLLSTYIMIVLSFVFIFTYGVLQHKTVDWMRPDLRFIIIGSMLLLFTNKNIKHTREKRDRFYALLPLSLFQSGIIRLGVFIIYLISLSLLFIAGSFIAGRFVVKWDIIREILTLSGIIFTFISSAYFLWDLHNCFSQPSKRLVVKMLGAVMMFVLYFVFFLFVGSAGRFILMEPLREYLTTLYNTFSGVLLFLPLSLGIMFLDAFIFSRGKSYLD